MKFSKMILLFVMLARFSLGLATAQNENSLGNLWVLQQDFVKFGKKESYDALKEKWLQKFSLFLKKERFPPLLAIHEEEGGQYAYLTPLKNFSALDAFRSKISQFEQGLSIEDFKMLQVENSSLINFRTFSLHQFLPRCSSFSGPPMDWKKNPYVQYYVYSITPGNDEFFESRLEGLVQKISAGKVWMVWKVLFGADVPKYLICLFASTEKELKKQVKQIEFFDPAAKEIIRYERQGRGLFRPELSLF